MQRLQSDQAAEIHRNPRTKEETIVSSHTQCQGVEEDGSLTKEEKKSTEFYFCGHSRVRESGYCLMDHHEHCVECLCDCDNCKITICTHCSELEEIEGEKVRLCFECDRPFQRDRLIRRIFLFTLAIVAAAVFLSFWFSKSRAIDVTEYKPKYISNYALAVEHDLLHGPIGKSIELYLGAGIRNEFLEDQLSKMITEYQLYLATTSPFPPQQPTTGDFIIGYDKFQNTPRRCDLQVFNDNFAFISRSGGGKSTALMWWAPQIGKIIPHLIVECKKSGLKNSLKPIYDRLGIELEIIDGEGCWNPLEPEKGVRLRHHAIAISEAIGLALGSEKPAMRALMKSIFRLYKKMNSSKSKQYPTLYHLRNLIAFSTKINNLVKDSIIERLDRVLLSTDSFRFTNGWKTEDLCKRRILLDLSKFPDEVQDVIINCFISKEFLRRIHSDIYNPDQMDFFIMFDDSQRLTEGPNTALSRWFGITRGTGIGLGIFQQNISTETSSNVLSNCGNLFLGPVSDSRTLKTICDSIGLLSYEQMRWLSNNLVSGVAICSVNDGSKFPSLIEIPNLADPEVRDYFHDLTEERNGHLPE